MEAPAAAAEPGDQMRSEFATRPAALVVHDAAAGGAFSRFAGVDPSEVERTLLFRQAPVLADYRRDYAAFRETLGGLGIPVLELVDLLPANGWPSLATNPNHVFTRDAAITLPSAPDFYLPARMREPLRRPETEVVGAALSALGLSALPAPPEHVYLEGGDVVPFERDGMRSLLVGFGPRTTESALAWLEQLLVPDFVDEVVGLPLGTSRMNLDGGFLPIGPDLALIEPTSFDRALVLDGRRRREHGFRDLLAGLGMRLVEVSVAESVHAQACNAVCLGDGRIVYYDLAPRVARALRRAGVARCMSRPLYGKLPAFPAARRPPRAAT
jgi:N-dimethylarginine dimethylaminohydrolase